jgi:hypothetical protein
VSYRAPMSTADGFAFVGNCSLGVQTAAPQDESEWTRIRFLLTVFGIPPGSRINTITIIYDEGTEATSTNPTSQEPSGIGLAVIDNIAIDEKLITRGAGIAPNLDARDDDDHDRDGKRNDRDDDDDNDGRNDHDDDDDDDDSYRDDRDGDDDNDGFSDRYDSPSHRETMATNSIELGPGETADFTLTPEAGSSALIAELDDAQFLITEVINPLGIVVGRSLPGVGLSQVEIPVPSSGSYTIRVRNVSLTPAAATSTTITRRNW